MEQSIDRDRLRAAADRFESVAAQYPDNDAVQGLLEALRPLLDAAKTGQIIEPMDLRAIPGGWHLAEGTFRDLRDPNVEQAYGTLSTELQGGWSDQEKRLLARIAQMGRGDGP